MFTFVNSKKTAIFFDMELRKILLDHREEKSVVSLVIGRVGKPDHKLELGKYKMSKALIDGLSSLDKWIDGGTCTLQDVRDHLAKHYSSIIIEE